MCKCRKKPVTIEYLTFIGKSTDKSHKLIGVKAPIKLIINNVEKNYKSGDLINIPNDIYQPLIEQNFPIWSVG